MAHPGANAKPFGFTEPENRAHVAEDVHKRLVLIIEVDRFSTWQ